jgi:hypothetical protein
MFRPVLFYIILVDLDLSESLLVWMFFFFLRRDKPCLPHSAGWNRSDIFSRS